MNLGDFISVLHDKLSPNSKILTDQKNNDFKTSLERWSNIDLQVPGAIIKPANETDVVITVGLISNPKHLYRHGYETSCLTSSLKVDKRGTESVDSIRPSVWRS